MHVERYGNGPRVCIALHGWGGGHRDFAALAQKLPAEALLVCPDAPGYGKSPAPCRWDLGDIADDMAVAALAVAGEGPVEVAGFCSGAVLAFMMARRRPQRISRMVMIDPFSYVPMYFRLFLAGSLGRRAYETAFVNPHGRRVVNRILQAIQNSSADFTAAFEKVDHDVALRYLYLFHHFGSLEPYRDLPIPIEIAQGETTFRAVRRSVAIYRELWPQARIHRLRRVGHLPLVLGARQLVRIMFPESGESPAKPARTDALT